MNDHHQQTYQQAAPSIEAAPTKRAAKPPKQRPKDAAAFKNELDRMAAHPKVKPPTGAQLVEQHTEAIKAAHAAGYTIEEITNNLRLLGYQGISTRLVGAATRVRTHAVDSHGCE